MSEGATVYILRCADGSLYVGITRRMKPYHHRDAQRHAKKLNSGLFAVALCS